MISLRPQENTFLYLTEAFQPEENVGHSIIMDLKKLRKIQQKKIVEWLVSNAVK